MSVLVFDRESVAEKVIFCMRQELSVEDLVDWSRRAETDGDFIGHDAEVARGVVGRIGRNGSRYAPAWGELNDFLHALGFKGEVTPSRFDEATSRRRAA